MPSNLSNAIDVAVSLKRDKLDDLRRAHGISTEAELARRIGVTPSTLWRISTGEVAPSNKFIARVCVAFPSATLDQLFEVRRVA